MNAFAQLLINPTIISLCIGAVIGSVSFFRFPAQLMSMVSIYLIFTIGFKGGACLGTANACTPPLIGLTLIGIFIGFIQPFINYVILKKTTLLDKETRTAVATQYGSISIVTFVTALAFLNERHIPYDSFMLAVAGILEIPALFSGLWLLKKEQNVRNTSIIRSIIHIVKPVLACKKLSFIFIGFFVGLALRNYHGGLIHTAIISPFNLILILFMLDIGIKIAKQRDSIHHFRLPLIAFGIYMPIAYGCIGVLIGNALGLYIGTTILFAVLMASASYIAVPAVMSTQTKNAKEAVYMPMALGITLPFNILVGIPIFYYLASYLR